MCKVQPQQFSAIGGGVSNDRCKQQATMPILPTPQYIKLSESTIRYYLVHKIEARRKDSVNAQRCKYGILSS